MKILNEGWEVWIMTNYYYYFISFLNIEDGYYFLSAIEHLLLIVIFYFLLVGLHFLYVKKYKISKKESKIDLRILNKSFLIIVPLYIVIINGIFQQTYIYTAGDLYHSIHAARACDKPKRKFSFSRCPTVFTNTYPQEDLEKDKLLFKEINNKIIAFAKSHPEEKEIKKYALSLYRKAILDIKTKIYIIEAYKQILKIHTN